MIVIIDYGAGNVKSIQNILKRIGSDSIISNEKEIIEKASKLILPGVGSFDYGMSKLSELDLIPLLNNKVIVKKTPILGICLGMQLLAKKSEEGKQDGLSWVDAEVKKFVKLNTLDKIPHMGWGFVDIKRKNNLISLDKKHRFYFVHSYYMKAYSDEIIYGSSNYINEFTSFIIKDNIYGVQFHPEKSHKFGMELMSNFIKI